MSRSAVVVRTPPEPPRRGVAGRQADRVDAIVAATLEELRTHGYDGLTVRNAARRAGVAPATAYTYFGSKDHLVAEVFMRRLEGWDAPDATEGTDPIRRVRAVLHGLASLVAAEPELAAASTTAILANDPDVHRLRDRIGAAFSDRLRAALGDDHDPVALRTLNLLLSGALLQAGMGYFDYKELGERMTEVVERVLR